MTLRAVTALYVLALYVPVSGIQAPIAMGGVVFDKAGTDGFTLDHSGMPMPRVCEPVAPLEPVPVTEAGASGEEAPRSEGPQSIKVPFFKAEKKMSLTCFYLENDEELLFGDHIGAGAVGEIQAGDWRGTSVAIKTLKREFGLDSQQCKDFVKECGIAARQNHRNVVATFGMTRGTPPIMVQELMRGGDLETYLMRMHRRKGCPWVPDRELLLGWCQDLARAVSYLHEQGTMIIHRDIKPANLFMTEDCRTLKLGDFGLAKPVEGGLTEQYQMSGHVGTIRYMAPEVFSGVAHYSEKVDIYSCAMVMFMMATGEKPFAEFQDADELGTRVVNGLRPSIRTIEWEALGKLIQRAWSADPAARPSAREMLAELNEMQKEVKEEHRSPTSSPVTSYARLPRSASGATFGSSAFSQIRFR